MKGFKDVDEMDDLEHAEYERGLRDGRSGGCNAPDAYLSGFQLNPRHDAYMLGNDRGIRQGPKKEGEVWVSATGVFGSTGKQTKGDHDGRR